MHYIMKHLFSDPELSFNQIVFEHRNKEYGAYDLRTESNRILAKSLFLSLVVIAGVSLTAFVFSPKGEVIVDESPPFIELDRIYEVPDKKPEPEVVKPETQAAKPAAQNIKTFDNRELNPTRNADDSKISTKKPDDAVAGTVDNPDGAVTTQNQPTTITPQQGTSEVPVKDPVIIKPAGDGVVGTNELSVAANFIGGIDAFRNKVIDKFDTADFENEGVISTTVTFIVEKDGTISGLKADGKNADFNKEAIRTIMSIKGKWTPGKDKFGQAVRSYFKFPVKMKFDQ